MRQIVFAAFCFVLGCSKGPSPPQISSSNRSPDGKYLAEVVERVSGSFPVADRHFEVRITSLNTNHPQEETIYRSADEGHPTERLLWSKDSRYLLIVGQTGELAVDAEDVTTKNEVIYLLYDSLKREVRCNESQLKEPMQPFGFKDLAAIDFGEEFRPEKRN